jgi:hypothetical protein
VTFAASAIRIAPMAAPASPNLSAGWSITIDGEKEVAVPRPGDTPKLSVESSRR